MFKQDTFRQYKAIQVVSSTFVLRVSEEMLCIVDGGSLKKSGFTATSDTVARFVVVPASSDRIVD